MLRNFFFTKNQKKVLIKFIKYKCKDTTTARIDIEMTNTVRTRSTTVSVYKDCRTNTDACACARIEATAAAACAFRRARVVVVDGHNIGRQAARRQQRRSR